MINAVNGVNALLEQLDNYQLQNKHDNRETRDNNAIKESAYIDRKSKTEASESDNSHNSVNYAQFAEDIKGLLDKNNLSLEFSVDDSTKKMIMKVIDSETNEVIRQFPEELSLKIARLLSKTLDSGQITNAKV